MIHRSQPAPAPQPQPAQTPVPTDTNVSSAAPVAAAQPVGGVTPTPAQPADDAQRLKGLKYADLYDEYRKRNNPLALKEFERRSGEIVTHLKSAEVKETIVRTLTASGLVAEDKVKARADQCVSDAVAQVMDRQVRQPDRYLELATAAPAKVAAGVYQLAASNITAAHTAGQAFLLTRYNKADGTIDVAATPGIPGLTDVLKRAFPPQTTGFCITTGVVRAADTIKVVGGTLPRIEHETNLFPEPGKANPYVGAYAVISTNGNPPLHVFYTVDQIEKVNGGKKLGENTFYKKTPEKELTNVVLREAQRRFIKERTVANEALSNVETMLRTSEEETSLIQEAGPSDLVDAPTVPVLPGRGLPTRPAPVEPTIVTATARPGAPTAAPAQNAFEAASENLGAAVEHQNGAPAL